VEFFKYQATGNDFIVLDNRESKFSKENNALIAEMCDRRFGIGADGLMLLELDRDCDFKMVYYNSDGNVGSMCGNGGRSIVSFARHLGLIDRTACFRAADGLHRASIEDDQVSLEMLDVSEVRKISDSYFLNTGSPHHVQQVDALENFNVFSEGRRIRNDVYGKIGANVNFVCPLDSSSIAVRTYERGVEDETLSCGTGVTAAALAMHSAGFLSSSEIKVNTKGGKLRVSFESFEVGGYRNIWLTGPAKMVFRGIWL
jgi:diaminopimelate epimerase